jgi:predicted dehydrogenase
MRIAIVEMGPHGKRILEVAQKIPSFEVVAIADRNPAVFEEINLDGTKTYSDALQLLKNHNYYKRPISLPFSFRSHAAEG